MRYDAIVIGSGQGGNPLAVALAERGWHVALVERAQVGGTCINYGCTPTKTLVASAQVAHYVRHARRWGVDVASFRVDLPEVVRRKRDVVRRFRDGKERQLTTQANLRLVRGHARFVAPYRLQVGAEQLEADRIVINTGTRAEVPAVDGIDRVRYLTNASLMELSEIPEHLVVLGGGYVGLELGQVFRRFGSRVTIVHRGPVPLAREDPDVAAELQKALEAEGVAFELRAKTRAVRESGGGVRLLIERDGAAETIEGSHLLVATGRRPNTDDLGLDRAGVATDARGYVKVNASLETTVPGIYAIGDAKGGPAFTHISYNDFQVLSANLLDGARLTIENRQVPYAVFTDPQLGRVGLTEAEARARGHRVKVGRVPMSRVARAIERDETAGLMKIVVDAAGGHVLGAAILASEGGELIHVIATLMLTNSPYTVLRGAIYIHPTLAEGFFTLMEEVQAAPVEDPAERAGLAEAGKRGG